MLALASLALGIGNVIWAIIELQDGHVSFPSWANVAYLTAYPFSVAGILLMPTYRLTMRERLLTLLDMTIIFTIALSMLWAYAIGPTIAIAEEQPLSLQLVLFAAPIGDILLCASLIFLLYYQAGQLHTGPLLLLALALGIALVADTVYAHQVLMEEYQRAAWLDIGWVVASLFYGIAGFWQAACTKHLSPIAAPIAAPSRKAPCYNAYLVYLPYLCILLAYLFMNLDTASWATADMLPWSMALIIALILLRQLVTLYDNQQLFVQANAAFSQMNHQADVLRLTSQDRQAQIHNRQQVEAQLTILLQAVEQSPIAILVTTTAGLIEYINPKYTQMTGFALADVQDSQPALLLPSQPPSTFRQQLQQVLQSGDEWSGELQIITKAGQPYWEYGMIAPITDSQGQVTHLLVMLEDITQRKQQMREQEALLAIATALRATSERDAMLSIILQQVALSLNAEMVFYIAPDPVTNEMVIEASYEQNRFRLNLNLRLPPGRGISAQVYRTGCPYVTDNIWTDPLVGRPELFGEYCAVSCVPLLTQRQTIGLLMIARHSPWSENDVRLLGAIADMTATGLERAALHERTARYAADLEQEVAARTHELQEANVRLQELDRLKSKFVSDVTHELRTPITNMGLYLDLFERKPEKQAHYVALLREQANRLETLVKDVLDLARLDHQQELLLTPVNLNELLTSVVAAHQAKAESLGLTLFVDATDNLPLILGDANKLIQVITNLVVNALNYTGTGQVRVYSHANPMLPQVHFAVEDTGMGIHAEDLPHLFERLYRGRREDLVDVPGSGLGLSIVKELVELHQGTITVQSTVGCGTTFTVSLPVQPPTLDPATAGRSAQAPTLKMPQQG
ncbi:MAG: PAS domain S-box protein [Caldilineaceae bacterium]|nr:PAS domain S-box protein [Caldilineaceae bacterium]